MSKKQSKEFKVASDAEVNQKNYEAMWKTYNQLKNRADQAIKKLNNDIRKNVDNETLMKDRADIILLLGECDYMAREYQKLSGKKSKKA
jgi:hypothetical protein